MIGRAIPYALGMTFFLVPFFPSFILLANVPVPGVSIVPLPVTWALLALITVMAAGVLTEVARTRGAVPLLHALLIWLGAAALASLLGFDPLGGALFLIIFGFGILWYVTVMRFYAPAVTRIIYPAFLISGAAASLAAIVMVLTKTPAAQYTIGHGRATGTFILPGELAGYLLIYLPVAYGVARTTNRQWLRWISMAGLAAGSIAFFMTFSRAAEIGLAAAVVFYLVVRGGSARIKPALAVLAAAAALVAFAFNAHHNPSENYTRVSIWQAALQIIERFPLTGVGLFGFSKMYALVRLPDGDATAFHAHSFILTTAAEMGLVGVAAVAYAWVRFAAEFRARLRLATPAHATLAVAVAAGLVGTWVQGLIDTVSVVIFGLWLPFMAIALCSASEGLLE